MSVGSCISVELLPSLPENSIASRLQGLLAQSTSVRGLLAYWTLSSDWLVPDHVSPFSSRGFLCVDIHLPTSIDELAAMEQAGVQVYLHLFDISGQTELPGTIGLPQHLMHAKSVLFDLADGTSILWTGSHNGTHRALYGVNVEASLLITLDRDSVVYREAESFVEEVRQKCLRFDLALIGYYKWLQGADDAENAIELEDALDEPIPNTTITLFGTDDAELKQLDRVEQKVIVSLTSAISRRERFYRATIEKTGKLRGIDKFDACRWAHRNGTALPVLVPVNEVSIWVMELSYYFVSLHLDELMPETTRAYAPPEKRQWEPVQDALIVKRLPQRPRTGRRRDKDREPVLRKAAPPEVFLHTEKTLDTRRSDKGAKLVNRVVLNVDGKYSKE